MNEQEIDVIGKEISLAYKFYLGYGYFLSNTVAQWLGDESLSDWEYQTILDLIAIDYISKADRQGNKHAQNYMMYFRLHGTYTGRQTVLNGGVSGDINTMFTAIKLQKAIAPQFIPEFEV